MLHLDKGIITPLYREGRVELDEIQLPFRSKLFCVGMKVPFRLPGQPSRMLAFLCDDEGLRYYEARQYTLTMVRPWDGSPLVGPILVVEEKEDSDGDHYFIHLDPELKAGITGALKVLGWRLV